MDSGSADFDAISVQLLQRLDPLLELARKNTMLAKYSSASIRTGFIASTTLQLRAL